MKVLGDVHMTDYPSPVAQLLSLGDPRNESRWQNYLALGVRTQLVPDLIRMALDEELHWADSESTQVWASIHALRALGQLRAEAAVEPLLHLFRRIDEDNDDWVGEELPKVYGMIGPAAIPALTVYLADESHGLWARVGASGAPEEIGKQHPESRAPCVATLTHQLEQFAKNDTTLNGSLLADLLDLHAVEAAPTIERAFAAKAIDENVAGGWEDVQVKFSIKEKRTRTRSRSLFDVVFDRMANRSSPPPSAPSNPQVDAAIARLCAEGVLKSPTQPKIEKPKKKHKRKK
jgi:Protein of unknown function (DUF1186)